MFVLRPVALLLSASVVALSAHSSNALYLHDDTEVGIERAIAATAYSIPEAHRDSLRFVVRRHGAAWCARVLVEAKGVPDPAFVVLRYSANPRRTIVVEFVGPRFELPLLEYADGRTRGPLNPVLVDGRPLRLGEGVWGLSAPPCVVAVVDPACVDRPETVLYVARNQSAISFSKTILHELLHSVLRQLALPHLHSPTVDPLIVRLEVAVSRNVSAGLRSRRPRPIRIIRLRWMLFPYEAPAPLNRRFLAQPH